MKNIISISLIALFIIIKTNSNTWASNIGILDVDKIIQESLVVIDIQKKVDAKKISYESEINKKQSDLEDEQKKLEDKKIQLSQAAFEKELKIFESKIENLKTFVDRRQNSLKKASIDAMGKVNDKVKSIVVDIAKEKNIDIVIPSSQTIHFDDSMDITSEVLKSLNKKITKIDVKFE